MRTINIWCDASQRRVDKTELRPRGRKISIAAWIADTGYCWYDLVYAKTSHDAEVTAVLVALYWALEKEYERINLFTDDRSIPESLYSKNKSKNLGNLPQMIKESTAEVNIIPINREKNQAAHNLCNKAYEQFKRDKTFSKRAKKARSYLTQDSIPRAQKCGWMKAVYNQFAIDQRKIKKQSLAFCQKTG